MFDIQAPSAKDVVIIGGVAFLIFVGMRMTSNYHDLVKENSTLSEQTAQLSSKNDALIKSVADLTSEVKSMNDIVATESRRRAAAEMKSQRLQDEVKNALKNSMCSVELIPAGALVRMREAADGVRNGKATTVTDSGQPTDGMSGAANP